MKMSKAEKAKCATCTLASNIFVPSEIHDSKIIALAEAPSYNETREGRPLVGVAGKDLDLIIESIGQTRSVASYLNSVSCRPTTIKDGKVANRTPTEKEVSLCNDRLIYEIQQIEPLVIVAMGRTSYKALGGKTYPYFLMSDVVGSEFTFLGFTVLVTYHPAAISHSGGITTANGRLIRNNIKSVFERALTIKDVHDDANVQLELL